MATELAKMLKKLIVDGASYRSLGRDIDINPATVKRIVEGEGVRMNTLEKVADYLGMPPGQVFRLALRDDVEPVLDESAQLIREMMYRLPNEIRQRVEAQFIAQLNIELEFIRFSQDDDE